MVTTFKWLMRLTTAVVVLFGAAVFLVYYLASRSLPDYQAELEVADISSRVEIVRNNANVPHIFGETDRDVYFGLGFAHAQDRLWQMLMMRRTAQGRLSEVFGDRTFALDALLRRLDLYDVAVDSVDVQDAETMAALQGYADGVNARLKQINEDALGRGAPELFIFSNEIAPWAPADSVAVLKLMSLQLSSHLQAEVLRARASLLLQPERVSDILPDPPGTGIAALPSYAALFPSTPKFAEVRQSERDPLSPVRPWALAGASNAWAAGPDRSAAGSTLLANDPHLGFTAPTVWYLARIELEAGGVIGGTIPGLPLVLVGRSDDLAWALTSSYLDDQDLFMEKLNPDNPEEYTSLDGFKAFRTRDSIIKIKDAEAVTIKLRWTDNGPVLSGDDYETGPITPPGHVAALSWTGLSRADTSISAARSMMEAGDVSGMIAAAEGFISPSQNLTVIDRENIGLKLIGAVPVRAINHESQGRIPSQGWLAQNRWQGRMTYESNPEFINPEGGILGNTNNKLTDAPFPLHVSFTYGDSQRILRWRQLMQSREVHTRESFIEAQLDEVSLAARTLLALVGQELWHQDAPAADGTPERLRRQALDLLADWNGEMNEHVPEPLIYSAWLRALQDRLIRDELGPVAQKFSHVEPLFIERVFRDIDGAAVWCDVVQSSDIETCTDMARDALDDALIWISENHGGALESLRWGDVHQASHTHQALGGTRWFKWVTNIRQSTSGGDHTLLRGKTSGSDPEPFLNVHGAGYRGVYDLADPDSSVFVVATGQSGHPLSRYYDDLGELWRRGEYIPMSLDRDLAWAGAVGITTLVPASP